MAGLPGSLRTDINIEPIPIEPDQLLEPNTIVPPFDTRTKKNALQHAHTYLHTGSLPILSASLRGPFDAPWRNPWISSASMSSTTTTKRIKKASPRPGASEQRLSARNSITPAKRSRLMTPEELIAVPDKSKAYGAAQPATTHVTPDKTVSSSLPTPAESRDRSLQLARHAQSSQSPSAHRCFAQSSPLRRKVKSPLPRPALSTSLLASPQQTSKAANTAIKKACRVCGKTDSKQWKKGPQGPGTLCCSCGGKWAYAARQNRVEAGIVRGLKSAGWLSPGSKRGHPASRTTAETMDLETNANILNTIPRRSTGRPCYKTPSTPMTHEAIMSKVFPKSLVAIERSACKEAVNLRQKASPEILKWQKRCISRSITTQQTTSSSSFASPASATSIRRPTTEKRQQKRRVDLATPRNDRGTEPAASPNSKSTDVLEAVVDGTGSVKKVARFSPSSSSTPLATSKNKQSTQALMDTAFTDFRAGLHSTAKSTPFLLQEDRAQSDHSGEGDIDFTGSPLANKQLVNTQALFDELDGTFVSPAMARPSVDQTKPKKSTKRASFAQDLVVREDTLALGDQLLQLDEDIDSDVRNHRVEPRELNIPEGSRPLTPRATNTVATIKPIMKPAGPFESQSSFDLDGAVEAGVDLLDFNGLV